MEGFVYFVFSKFNFLKIFTLSDISTAAAPVQLVHRTRNQTISPTQVSVAVFDLSLLLNVTVEKGFNLDLQQAIP